MVGEELLGLSSAVPNVASNAGYVVETIVFLATWLIPIGLWFWLMYWVTKRLKFKHLVIIKQKVGNTFKTIKDAGAIFTDKKTGIIYYKLKKYKPQGNPKGRLKVPPATSFTNYKASGLLDIFYKESITFIDEDGVIIPATIKEDNQFEPIEQEAKQWMINDYREAENTYNKLTFFDKYGMIITQFINIVVIFVLFLIMIEQLKGVGGSLNAAAQAFDKVADKFEAVAGAIKGASP